MRDQGQLGANAGARAVELQGFGIGLAGHPGVEVTQIFVGCGVAWIGANGLLERLCRLALLTVGCVQHGQVVVGLRHAREFAGQRRENLDGLGALLLLGRNHAAHEAHFDIVRVLLEVAVGLLGGLIALALLEQLSDLVHCAGRVGRQAAEGNAPAHTDSQHGA